nr:hypothetical protein [Tanacetum cinerariifolium]
MLKSMTLQSFSASPDYNPSSSQYSFFFFSSIAVQTSGSGISNLLAVATTFTGSMLKSMTLQSFSASPDYNPSSSQYSNGYIIG